MHEGSVAGEHLLHGGDGVFGLDVCVEYVDDFLERRGFG